MTTKLIGYFPIWGATFDSEGVGLFGESEDLMILAFIPLEDEWMHVQRSAVWWERYADEWGLSKKVIPPLCLVTDTIRDSEMPSERLYLSMAMQAYDTVLALRLFKEGWFLDPDLSEQLFTHDGIISRNVGPYRQIFMDGVPDGIPPPYHLNIDDLASKAFETTPPTPRRETPLTTIWKVVRRYREQGANTSADIAIENFHRSYGLWIHSWQRVAFLFTALDAMLGGMSIREIGNIRLRSMFRDRVTVALQAAAKTTAGAAITPVDEASWLDSEGRRIRNDIAHGNPTQVAIRAQESYSRIQAIIRLILRQYVEFSTKWASQAMYVGSQYGVAEDTGLTAAYNKILDAHARGVADAMDVLMPANSPL